MAAETSSGEVTQLLKSWRQGDSEAFEDLLPLVYDELRRLAASYLRKERRDHTLQPTALVHEAYLRLSGGVSLDLQDRAHFFTVAARAMRRVLVDHARRHRADKRIGVDRKVSLDDAPEIPIVVDIDVLAVHEALELLAQIEPRQAQLVELRYFGGLSNPEAAEVQRVSVKTVERDWRIARAWLHHRLSGA